jgi:hypothetical protein
MALVTFTARLHKFGEQGEKTGWTCVEIPADIAQKIKPGNKKDFKVKGKLDAVVLKRRAVMPMGGGLFILPLNKDLLRALAKKAGAMVKVQLEEDKSDFVFNADFIECLADDPPAKVFFESLSGSHQRYFSKWIDSAKTEPTKVKRITMAVNALSKKMGYPEMIRASQEK